MLKKIYSSEFQDLFSGNVILHNRIKEKLYVKHKVYEADLHDALTDDYAVVLRSSRQSPLPPTGHETKGTVYDIYAGSGDGRVLFVVGRLFPDGALYIISARWAKNNEEIYYYKAREVLFDE